MTDVAKSHPPTKPSTAKGKYGVLPPRSPNPVRASRVAHPGAPDMKRGKRTTAQVTEAAKRKEEARLRLEMLEQEKLEIHHQGHPGHHERYYIRVCRVRG